MDFILRNKKPLVEVISYHIVVFLKYIIADEETSKLKNHPPLPPKSNKKKVMPSPEIKQKGYAKKPKITMNWVVTSICKNRIL